VEEVDAFFRGLEALPDTPEGRQAALELFDEASFKKYHWEWDVITWFRLCYRNGYAVGEVNKRMDDLYRELRVGALLGRVGRGVGGAGETAPGIVGASVAEASDAAVVASSVVGVPGPVFRVLRRNGYDTGDVDAFIDRLGALPDTAEGKRAACELAGAARFHLSRRNGYDPGEVDGYIDAVIKSWRRDDGPRPA
jgi:DivIVA domain-containing protein